MMLCWLWQYINCATVGGSSGQQQQQRRQLCHPSFILFLTFANMMKFAWATTEWFGDLRANAYPPRSPPFYDVIYDDSECPDGLESEAIPEYAYFGPMVASMSVLRHADCLDNCLRHPKCVAVNFFAPIAFQENGFCELLNESQLDNPRLMRPFKHAAYFDNIRCRVEDDFLTQDTANTPLERPPKAGVKKILKKLSERVNHFNLLHRQRRRS